MKELLKTYNPSIVEKKWYEKWETNKVFSPNDDSNLESYAIVIPPPNVTGKLHLGHVLNNTIQDVLIRKARMQGKNTLWLPGTDHASIATEAKVTKKLQDDGIDKNEIGRDEFLKHAWQWKDIYGGTIINQLKRLGCSCDWNREKFTMDEDYSNAVLECFVKLYNDGLIYKGERIINWDPKSMTALSDEEVIYKETKGNLWHFKYPIKDSKEFIIVATTRPETMLGDTGIAVNPNDKRYINLIGKSVILPIVNKEIPIFGDEYVDMEFGTGCVKVTPAHDPNDFNMGTKNNLEIINIFNPDGSINDNAPQSYIGLDRFEARKKIVKEIDSLGLLDKINEYTHNVGYSERTDAIVEPYLSNQWYIKMDTFAKEALSVVEKGKIKFYPSRWTKIYNHWLNNIKDWCISRQLWWGHRIPVWYRGSEIYCGIKPPPGKNWIQDEDVLDTWFSSWIWPMATLGWPKKTKALKTFYPTQDLVTGADIIFFWVARMIMAGLHFEKQIPFSNVYFNGIVRDDKGRKMSKSLGNSPDPLDLIDEFGADALRVGMLLIAPQGSDIIFSKDRIEIGRNFINKLWNSARFVIMNIDDEYISINDPNLKLNKTDKWIISKLNKTILNVNDSYGQYKLNESIKLVYDFVWSDFCDWYIEFSKVRFYGQSKTDKKNAISVCIFVLKTILKLLHPYIPFITEEIWTMVSKNDQFLTISSWPSIDKTKILPKIENEISIIKEVISSIRNIKTNLGISPSKNITIILRGPEKITKIIENYADYLLKMVKVKSINSGPKIKKPLQSAVAVVNNIELFIPLVGLIDLDKEKSRLENQIQDLVGRLSSVNSKLNNKNFISRAPENVVKNEQTKQKKYMSSLEKLKVNLKSLE